MTENKEGVGTKAFKVGMGWAFGTTVATTIIIIILVMGILCLCCGMPVILSALGSAISTPMP